MRDDKEERPKDENEELEREDEDGSCPICLNDFNTKIGTPESCDHNFCLLCLQEWSRVRKLDFYVLYLLA